MQNQNIAIIGGTSGIGLATALLCMDLGAQVTVAGRSQSKIDAALEQLGQECRGVQLDAGSDAQVAEFFADHGPFDHVVMSAAVFRFASVRNTAVPDAKSVLDEKFWLHYRVGHYASLKDDGSLTFVGGTRSRKLELRTGLLSITQSALETMARQLAIELAPVRVNVVSPGIVDTPIHDPVFGGPEAKQDVYREVAKKILLRRIGKADEVAELIVSVMTNRYINGAVFDIDGGDLLV
jgi:NAD(P)-dependent dehydrogenase (short-subunit alcohol dehydrogenase family)